MKLSIAVAALILIAAAALRIPALAERPMHADEAIYAVKLGTLLESGTWSYEPGEYHGPVLHYVTAVAARAAGVREYANLTETTLRVVPAVLGIVLVLLPLTLARRLGRTEALTASAFAAVSPAMVYYSRYYIPEMLLTCLTAALLAVVWRYVRTPRLSWAVAAGLLAGVMFATKETAVIAFGAILIAAFFASGRRVPDWRHLVVAGAATSITVALLLGPGAAIHAIGSWGTRAVQENGHAHPWHYYLHLLLWWRAGNGPVWSEGLIVLAALAGASTRLVRRDSVDARASVLYIAIYTLTMAVLYALIPYKTPWCLLGFHYGLILLAGVGAVFVLRRASGVMKPLAVIVLAGGSIHLLVEAVQLSRRYSSDPGNPYAYAHTERDVYLIRESLEKLTAGQPEGRNLPIQIISTQNVWPLPWYLRSFPRVEWRRGITDDMQPAAAILATPDMEPRLFHQLYEVLPPGQRPLYVSLFADYIELRPGMELRGYVQQSVWAASDLAAQPPAPR